MVLHNALDVVRRRWKAAVAAALVVALAGVLLVAKQQTADETSTSMTQVGVAGPLREHEYYSVDLNVVAADVVVGVSTYLTSDVTLRKIREQLPTRPSIVQLRAMIDVDVLPSSIIDIRASHAEPEIARLTVKALQKETLELVERLGEQRFDGDSPLTSTILIDTSTVDQPSSSPTVLVLLYVVLALVAAGAAAFLREVLDRRVRSGADVLTLAEGRAELVDGSARSLRAELDVRGARTILLVSLGASSVADRCAALVDAFRETGESCGALVLVDDELEGAPALQTVPEASGVEPGTTLVLDADAAAAGLTVERLSTLTGGLAGDGGRVVVLVGGTSDDAGFHLLRRGADAVVVVAVAGRTRKSALLGALRDVAGPRGGRGGELVWLAP